ncbi:MAG: efflux RND transporter periplasmic adaptor subunit [Xanthomonadales bacterium]|nr:efflux RND transporter periplasmic adaptor subunit [Xanthomonadales bacterium]
MKLPQVRRRTLALIAAIIPLLALFVYVVLRSGPLAPVAVVATTVQTRAISPALFGVGTVEARYLYKIGPTSAGRLQRLDVEVGDRVSAGQVLGEMDPVDLDDRVRMQEAVIKRGAAAVREASARQTYARAQEKRYEKLLVTHAVSAEAVAGRQQERQIADAVYSAAGEELSRARADREAAVAQRGNLRLLAPVDGLVVSRDIEPGTTVVAGQAVIEIIDTSSLWINARFDQISAAGLATGLPARITLRSRRDASFDGQVARVEPLADAVTEETLAKIAFALPAGSLPPVGELAEVTLALPALPATTVIPNAAIRRIDGRIGAWLITDGGLEFRPIRLGVADLDGNVQVQEGLRPGERIVLFSEKALAARSRIHVVDHLAGSAQ